MDGRAPGDSYEYEDPPQRWLTQLAWSFHRTLGRGHASYRDGKLFGRRLRTICRATRPTDKGAAALFGSLDGRTASSRCNTPAPRRRRRFHRRGILHSTAWTQHDGVFAFRSENPAVQVLTRGFNRNATERAKMKRKAT